ncbi:hypothetical protein [Alcanivorax quisquiliarum]|uniref:Uncharacterized protein n=1 Tax=Alcanivorax quisquiliarum TaxID=2933565 RepID=A0ABT0E6N3_9GAMM|nr:hypothetical protein [Alcanivorax quisquiliarum]MCK0537486.1 hypothetical protein [Alcanivorax quisquiliarum]
MKHLLASCLALGLSLHCPADSTPAPEDFLPPRPQLALYNSEHAFVAALLAWQRERDAVAEKIAQGELAPPPAPPPDDDWHKVNGPEDIDSALEKAAGFQQPHYRERYRFNRSTHVSFPLPALPLEQMAAQAAGPAAGEDQAR